VFFIPTFPSRHDKFLQAHDFARTRIRERSAGDDRTGQVVAVVGSGVSLATTSHAPTWRGLITSGVERCRTVGATDKWCERVLGWLESDADADMLLSAAELVQQKLREPAAANSPAGCGTPSPGSSRKTGRSSSRWPSWPCPWSLPTMTI